MIYVYSRNDKYHCSDKYLKFNDLCSWILKNMTKACYAGLVEEKEESGGVKYIEWEAVKSASNDAGIEFIDEQIQEIDCDIECLSDGDDDDSEDDEDSDDETTISEIVRRNQ